MKVSNWIWAFVTIGALVSPMASAAPSYALTAFGESPKYPASFTHFDYVNPDAPKGGDVKIAADDPLRFDHLIPYSMDGLGVRQVDEWVYAPLAYQSLDEPATVYGMVASGMEMAPDRSWLRFTLNPKAKFDDGTPITAADVAFTYDLMAHKAALPLRATYAGVKSVTVESPSVVRFDFDGTPSRILPITIATMPVLPKHWWQTRDFEQGGGFEPPLGSGPYRVAKVEPGQTVVFERVKNWWGDSLPAARGMFNFGRITLKVYGSRDVTRQATLAHDVDINNEKVGAAFKTGYAGPAERDGLLQRVVVPSSILSASGFVFNTRSPFLADIRVRKAIAMLWDFEWVNDRLYGGSGKRQSGNFASAEFHAMSLPTGNELRVLDPWRSQLPPEVFKSVFQLPVNDGSGNIRARQLEALKLLESAGWHPAGNALVNNRGDKFVITFLNINKGFERSLMTFKRSLAQIGITLNIRTVDIAQYGSALMRKQFDMIYVSFISPATPGNELFDYYSSATSARPGSQNWMGTHDPVIDAMVKGVQTSKTREEMETYMRALDRVLEWQYLSIPAFRSGTSSMVFWNRFGLPDVQAKDSENIDAWWVKSTEPVETPLKRDVPGREVIQ